MDSSKLVRNAGRDTPTTVAALAPTPSIIRHIAGLDGLRGIAVIAVMLFHAEIYWARGGYLGVDLFFVLSGFLITGLLATEIQQTGRLDMRRFYWRRAKRLLPAVWLMMASVTLIAALLAPDALPRLRGDALASFFYLTNWELLSVHVSYFDSTGRQPLLQHLWSLAIEEQFYIAWAILVPLGLALVKRRALAVVALVMAIASAAWMAVLATKMGYPGHGDPSRLYFGTDTHGFPLLLGATLGLAWQPALASQTVRGFVRGLGVLLGLLALILLLALFAQLGEETPTLYPWGLLLADVAGVLVIAMAAHPGLPFGRWLDCKPLRWMGERSYGIYLWHWPIFMLTRPGIDLRTLDPSVILTLRLVLSVGIAALSYRFLEMPIRHGALERLWRDWRSAATRRQAGRRAAVMAVTVVLVFGTTAEVLSHAPTHATPALDVREALRLDLAHADSAPQPVARAESSDPQRAESAPVEVPVAEVKPVLVPVKAAEAGPAPVTAAAAVSPQPVVESYTGDKLTAVGDSVLLGSSDLLKVTLHGVDVHAAVGAQAADILAQVKALNGAGSLRPVVLIHLGTNGYVYEAQLRQILALLKDCKHVILVNTHVPRRWMEANNEMIDHVAPDFPNVEVVRWSDISEGQPDYFVSDGVHLTDLGQRAFIANIMRTGHLVPDAVHATDRRFIDSTKDYATVAGDASPTLVLAPQPAASDKYWKKMALCETDAKWQNPGVHSGGLAISIDDWKTWGGLGFAKTPAEATPTQQIEIANRISTQGWIQADGSEVKPVGFVRWRCVVALTPSKVRPGETPVLFYTPESVIAQSFHIGERGRVVSDLQTILGTPRDGIYSKSTHRKHLAYLQKAGLPLARAGEEP